jgi:hypothetical protein
MLQESNTRLQLAIYLAIYSFPPLVFSHQGEKFIASSQWQHKNLTVQWDDNWPTEHCIDILDVNTMTYSFESEVSMKFDFHVHPNNENNEYQTDYFSKSDSIAKNTGEIITNKPGTYCFQFSPVKRHTKNSVIKLKYRLTPAINRR